MPSKKTPRKRHSTAEMADKAGMSDDAVQAKTGRTWSEWVNELDSSKLSSTTHRDIAKFVQENYDVSGWWAQTITVGYERIKGLRDVGQRRSGTYDANKSKTFPVPMDKLFNAFSEQRLRHKWLPNKKIEIRTTNQNKSMRIGWDDKSSVDFYFTEKGKSKSQVAVQHRGLKSKSEVEKKRIYWAERLQDLSELLSP